jgi:hypothetical protein
MFFFWFCFPMFWSFIYVLKSMVQDIKPRRLLDFSIDYFELDWK